MITNIIWTLVLHFLYISAEINEVFFTKSDINNSFKNKEI